MQIFERGYREIVSLPSALSAYREFFTAIAQDAHRPALFHCTTGKDRTGWAAATTLLLLGVTHEEDVLYDYELSNRDLLPAMKPLFEHFRAAGGNPRLLEPVLGVDPDYLRAALDEMKQRFGWMEVASETGLASTPTRSTSCATRSADRRNPPSPTSPPRVCPTRILILCGLGAPAPDRATEPAPPFACRRQSPQALRSSPDRTTRSRHEPPPWTHGRSRLSQTCPASRRRRPPAQSETAVMGGAAVDLPTASPSVRTTDY